VAPALNAWRAELGLPAVSRVFRSWLNSPQRVIGLFPPWFAPPQPDWPPALRLTGFPLFDESDPSKAADLDGGAETQDLRRFLDEGGAPIAFTPGTANAHAQRFLQAGVEAAVRLNRRALLLTRRGHQVPRDLPPSIRHVSYAPFSQLLPRCAALVHHGGIGTCAQALAAGIPQLVMPMGFDQPDNAARLKRLGVGAALVPAKFTGARVASELTTLLSHPAAAAACRHWSQAIAASRPIDETCDLLERIA
jgi:UDP:flavonoid glycosyltransferase YjiC (YdhE family)